MSGGTGEHGIARIVPDAGVGALNAGLELVGLFAAMAMVNLVFGVSGGSSGSSSGTLFSGVAVVAPMLWAWRARRRQTWHLTSRRLLCDGRTEVALADVTRIRVWPTSVWLHRKAGSKVVLRDLINPASVAGLIRNTIAANRGHA